MSAILIGIHGLSNKPEKSTLKDWWEKAIAEGLEKNVGFKNISFDFSLVYWADVTYPNPDGSPDAYKEAEPGALKKYEEGWTDLLKSGVFDIVGDSVDFMKKYFGMDAIADEVLARKLKDLARYYTEEEIRIALRERLIGELLAHQEKRIMILSHSMGTIIAYDVLRALGKTNPKFTIDHFITFGSPLGLPHVKRKIIEENPLIRTPSIVRQWTNFSDKRDPVALDNYLGDDYGANGRGIKVKDDLVFNDWEGIHHKSYGYLRTPELSKAIGNFIWYITATGGSGLGFPGLPTNCTIPLSPVSGYSIFSPVFILLRIMSVRLIHRGFWTQLSYVVVMW